MIHPDSELRFVNDTIGYGLFATKLIPKGTFTWVHDDLDQVIVAARLQQMPAMLAAQIRKYSYVDPRGHILCWDHGRFVNHSCEPSCRSTGFDLEIAVRDILPGEELTDDYGSLNIDYAFECHCGMPRCRHSIHANDMERYADDWDREARSAFDLAPAVPQPLWPLLKQQADVERALRGEMPLPSCRVHGLTVAR